MDPYILSVLAFLIIFLSLLYRNRKNVEINGPVIIVRSKKAVKFIRKISKYKKFWKIFGTLSIFISIILMALGIYFLADYTRLLLTKEVEAPGVSLVLPSLSKSIEVGNGFILLPFWYWILILLLVVVPHEISHGIMSCSEGVKLKSVGGLLLLFLPGAFVEPDEKTLKRKKLVSKLRIFAVGSVTNFLLYIFLFHLASSVWNYFVPGPIFLVDVNSTSPAEIGGLSPGMVLTEINGKKIKCSYDEFLQGANFLDEELGDVTTGDEITVVANGSEYHINISSHPENENKTYIGIVYRPLFLGNEKLFNFLMNFLTFGWLINQAIAIFNILPIYPLDGGRILDAVLEKVAGKLHKKITYIITSFFVFLLALNFLLPLFF